MDNSTFSGSYILTQADVDAETFTNTATVTGDCPQTQACATDDDDDTQPLINEPAIMLEKVGTLNDDDGTAGVSAGDTISYAFTVTNTGNVPVTNITITDPVRDGSGWSIGQPGAERGGQHHVHGQLHGDAGRH